MSNEKKNYTTPSITDLGDVVSETKGVGGDWWESYGSAYGPPLRPGDVFNGEQDEN